MRPLSESLEMRASGRRTLLTRDALLDGRLVDHARADAVEAGLSVRRDDELAASMRRFLVERPGRRELWVFGYGSLMWNPAFKYAERRVAVLTGWRRRLCLWAPIGRGTPERPGLLLALEKGGRTLGVAFRLPPEEEARELSLVWVREMLSDAYDARWLDIDFGDRAVEAVTFVANPDHDWYAGRISEAEIVDAVANATGFLGSSADYLHDSIAAMRELGLHDAELERINGLVAERRRASGATVNEEA